MPMYNSLGYIDSYSMTLGNLWNYFRDEVNNSGLENKVDDKCK